jgi:hypothetical protein
MLKCVSVISRLQEPLEYMGTVFVVGIPHICLRFMPKMKADKDTGFRSCTEYNEAR